MGGIVGERYRLERQLGEGGMGSVWAATHVLTGKHVAVKLLKEDLARDPHLVERFVREARAACAVVHPNVVQIHDVIQGSGPPAMVMDLLEGESLGTRLERGPLGLAELANLLVPVASAVAAAHRAGIVHRDLKPDNLFLARRPDGGIDVKVLDFGIAKITTMDGEVGPHTKTGAMVGTPFYMSPEQLFGEKDIDARADVWSMGIIVWECLVGRRPTQTDNLGQIVKIVTQTGIPPLASVLPAVPAEVSAIVVRMLMRDRAERLAHVEELGAVLERHRHWAEAPSGAPLVGATAAMTPNPWSRTDPKVGSSSKAAFLAVAGLVPLALLGALAFFVGRPYLASAKKAPVPIVAAPASTAPPVESILPPVPPPSAPSPAPSASLSSAPAPVPPPAKPVAAPPPAPKPASPSIPIHDNVPF